MRFANRMKSLQEDNKDLQDIMSLAGKSEVISFAGGFPSSDTYPIEDIEKSMIGAIEEDSREVMSYSPTIGYPVLREEISKRMANKFDLNFPIEQILLIAGSQQGLDLMALLLIDPGDVILFEAPSYLGALSVFKTYEANLVSVGTDEDGLILDDLKKALDTYGDRVKLIYVNPDHQNPTGRSWSLKRRKDFIDLVQAYDLAVMEDAAYSELTFDGETMPPLIKFDKKGQVIHLGTFSKIFCPGLRTGWVLASEDVIDGLLALKTNVDLSPPGVLQRQMAYYLQHNDLDAHIREITALYKARCRVMHESMLEYFPPAAKYKLPNGGLFFWVSLPEYIDTSDILVKAIDANVAFVPGAAFYTDKRKTNEMRLNFSNMPDEKIRVGIKILGRIIKESL